MEKEVNKLNKSIAIFNVVKETADTITRHVRDLPKDKHHKNIFVKSYNRRPRNKQKKAGAIVAIAIAKSIAMSQIGIITTQPIPKFAKGAINH